MSEKRDIALEARAVEAARMHSPSAARNRDPIRETFLALMPHQGTIVEIGSGTGEHAVHIAAAAPLLFWRPGDPDAASRASIAAWTAHLGLQNVDAPHAVDVTKPGWETAFGAADGVVSINMIHIAPFAAAEGLIAGASQLLKPSGRLFLYGPFSREGVQTAPSNAEFDAALKARDPGWGVRDLDRDIVPLAEKTGFALVAVVPMPANNLSVAFQKAP
jgi:cyclopropane fatty-acyl-phospholipid synthase-like methyltransferase